MQITWPQLINWLDPAPASAYTSAEWETVLTGVSTDTRTLRAGDLYIPLIGERFDGHDFIPEAVQAGARGVLCQADRELPHDIACPVLTVPNTLQALQQLARAYRRHLGIPVIAITGSNGKTTTKDLIAAVLAIHYDVHKTAGNLNNHIGLPLSLLSIPAQAEVAVVEMGMNHAGEIEQLSRIAVPDFAVITNVGDAHIAHFADRRAIAEAKLEIVAGLKPEGQLFINGDDPLLVDQARRSSHRIHTIGLSRGNDERATDVRTIDAGTTRFRSVQDSMRYELPLLGKHNVSNALFALAIGRKLGLPAAEMARGLRQVELSGRRLQLRKTAKGMWVLDDSYNANPTAVEAGIRTLIELRGKPRKWVLLGDILELGASEEQMHRDLGTLVGEAAVEQVFTVGERARWIHEAAQARRQDEERVVHFHTVEEATRELKRREDPEAVLLVKASRAMALDRVVEALCAIGKEGS